MTNRITPSAHRAVASLVLLLFAAVAVIAMPASAPAAQKVQASLRVVTWQGKILFDGKAQTGTTKVKPNTDCLGGSAGPARTVAGPTALNLLVAAAKKSKNLRPLTLSDGDFGFGICGIGGVSAENEEWWVLRHNWKDASVGAEGLTLKKNDKVLLYLSKTYMEPTPNSLLLKAPAKVKKGKNVRVRVLAVDGATGKRTPVKGAKVKGAARTTNAKGYTRIKVKKKTRTVARSQGFIPSNRTVIKIRR